MKFEVRIGKEVIESNGGLALAGKILAGLEAELKGLDAVAIPGLLEPKIGNGDVVRSYVGLLVLGRTNYEDVELYRSSGYFRRTLGIKRVPSCETLRQRLDASGGQFDAMLKAVNVELLRLGKARLTPVRTFHHTYMPMDLDVSPFDNSGSRKEGVGRTYKGDDGYAPNFVYLGAEGHMLNCELRPGTQHCQKGTPEFLRETFGFVQRLDLGMEVLLRMDAGNDAVENILLCPPWCRYLIKRNLRRESLEGWLAVAKAQGAAMQPRPGKTVYVGECRRAVDLGNGRTEELRIVFEVTERTSLANGQALLVAQVDVETWWTNLDETPATVIELYHEHGTSEQFHSELKSDMGVERLPSGKFATNATVLQAAMVAFNILRRIGQELLAVPEALPVAIAAGRRRLRSVLQDIMYLGCRYVRTARRHLLNLGVNSAWGRAFVLLHARL
jgi:hypothetical protein